MTNILKTFAFYFLIIPNLFVSAGDIVSGTRADQIKSISLLKAIVVNIITITIISAFVFALTA